MMVAIFFLSLFALAIILLIGLRLYSARKRTMSKAGGSGEDKDVIGISVGLEIDDKRSLYVLLGADGSINRLGTGTLDNAETGLFIGVTSPAVFESVRSHVSSEMWPLLGHTFNVKNPVGASCKLTILFQFKDGSSSGFIFHYGAESEGPPKEIAELVTAAVRATDPWYEEFKKSVARKGSST